MLYSIFSYCVILLWGFLWHFIWGFISRWGLMGFGLLSAFRFCVFLFARALFCTGLIWRNKFKVNIIIFRRILMYWKSLMLKWKRFCWKIRKFCNKFERKIIFVKCAIFLLFSICIWYFFNFFFFNKIRFLFYTFKRKFLNIFFFLFFSQGIFYVFSF